YHGDQHPDPGDEEGDAFQCRDEPDDPDQTGRAGEAEGAQQLAEIRLSLRLGEQARADEIGQVRPYVPADQLPDGQGQTADNAAGKDVTDSGRQTGEHDY